ncbi:hypothetical protein N234_28655 [Ralstonia pickettii DTP0602]|nr:hypothetical protein N234_28655 [Ralstonia pickettii DTP0602]
MFLQPLRNRPPHRVENEINAFATGLLGGWHEVSIPCYQNDLIHLLLEGK